jgi:hypothetical protein
VAFGVVLPSAATLNEELERIARAIDEAADRPRPGPVIDDKPTTRTHFVYRIDIWTNDGKISLSTSPALRTSLSRGRPIALHASGGQTLGLRCAREHVSWQIVGAEMTTADTA